MVNYVDELSNDTIEPTEVRELPLPRDNWYPARVNSRRRDWGAAPLSTFGLFDDGGADGARWFPVRPAPPRTVVTTIRPTEPWLRELDSWAEQQGLSRMAAIAITCRVGRRVLDGMLDRLRLSREEWERLIADE